MGRRTRHSVAVALAFLLLVIPSAGATEPSLPVLASTQETAVVARDVPASDLSPISIDPSGIAYVEGNLIISDSEIDETTLFTGVNLWRTTRSFQVLDTGLSPDPADKLEPNGLDYDPSQKRLFVSNDDTDSVFIVQSGPDGHFGTSDDLVQEWDATPVGAFDLGDVAFRTRDKSMFLLDVNTHRVFQVLPGPDGKFAGVPPQGDDVVTSFGLGDLATTGYTEGLGYRAASDTLLVTEGGSKGAIHEISITGRPIRSIDISFLRAPGTILRPADVTVAPASSGQGESMYVVDRGADSAMPPDTTPGPLDGRLLELQSPFTNLAPTVSAGPDRSITLSQSTTVEGSVVDDGQPSPQALTSKWRVVDGPGPVSFGDTTAARTVVGFNHTGTYTLELSATDGVLGAADTMVVTVGPSASGRFTDDDDSMFEKEIEWLAEQGITKGCNPPANTLFCPRDPVTRGQMAAFLTRALDLPPSSTDRFVDDDNSVFQRDIQALAAAGITRGCNPPANNRFCPDANVTRGEMAAFLNRALDLAPSPGDVFTDDNLSVFEADIQALAAADITRGCNPPANNLFCPNASVTREQMAAFLFRALADR